MEEINLLAENVIKIEQFEDASVDMKVDLFWDSDSETSCPQISFLAETSTSSGQTESQEINLASPVICRNERVRGSSESDEKHEENTLPAEKNYVEDVLGSTAIGKCCLSLGRQGALDNTLRCKVAELVVYAEFGANTNTVISRTRFIELANMIAACLPKEYPETYFIPSGAAGKGRPSRGKLYDAYHNLNKVLRRTKVRRTLLDAAAAAAAAAATPPPPPPPGAAPAFPPPPPPDSRAGGEVERQLEFLRTHLEPWEELKACWARTSAVRLRQLREDSARQRKVAEYFDRYPVLKQPGGYLLLEMDFAVLFKDAQHNWETKWPLFSEKLKVELIGKGIKEDSLACEAAVLLALPRLFAAVFVRVPGRRPWRASRADMREGFLLHLQALGDLEKALEGMRRTAQYRGTQLKPFALIVGKSINNITSSYVVIDDRPIRVESALRAVEVAFKVYHALDCQYPVQSGRVWTLLAKAVFAVEDAWGTGLATTAEMTRLIKKLQC